MRRTLPALLIVMSGLALTGCYHNWASSTTTMNQNVAHISGAPINVDTRNGRIEVIASDDVSEVTIEARIKCVGRTQAEADDRLARTTIEVGRDTDRTLRIRPVFADGPRGSDGASFLVRLPDAEGITLDTSNGSIVVRGTSGKLLADTSNGAIDVESHRGPINIDTSNGSIEILDGHAPIVADTSNGSITVSLADDQEGPVRLDTSNGRIRMTVGPAFAGRVTMSTSNGAVKVRDEHGRISSSDLSRSGGRIVVGEGTHDSRRDTSNGTIELTISG
jgi:DUF4097 and DUF4098 domain-containing protein YvlB